MAEWPPFRKVLLTQLIVFSFVFCLFVILVISSFGLEGRTLVYDFTSAWSLLFTFIECLIGKCSSDFHQICQIM